MAMDSGELLQPEALRRRGTPDGARPSAASSPWQAAYRRLRKNKLACAGLLFLLAMLLFCFVGPLFASDTAGRVSVSLINKPPSGSHWLGTDNLGRDVLTRLMQAGRISLLVGLVSMVLSIVLGSLLGAIAGFYRGFADHLIMRIADILLAVPEIPILIIIGAILSDLKVPSEYRIYMVMLMISFMAWPSLARLVRSQILSFRERPFMLAAEALGLRDRRKLVHLLLNAVPVILVVATLSVARAILSETVLSYLGLGVVPPTPSWGNMMAAANSLIDFQTRPWLWIPPGTAIFLTVIAINVLGDGLRDALDPRMKR
ncbi:Oligopeptide transport system permease protein OppC [Paenibacillus konkukensis]|uniref:Oligopeptide transport system permease protein OppC n=1 Tax=Paenibacillus konkukensis TaxID=2020716 RepID=A0ABY4RPA0_9BACL|nr:oligopeptide ABC transporter permease [Paenibacillus konkukensis]UQZ83785.1 Oligopeptide transport system permease protein OppC [Paenibacillus konkukensis]